MNMKATDKQLAEVFVNTTEEKDVEEVKIVANEFVKWLGEKKLHHRLRDIITMIDQVWVDKHGAANITVNSAHTLDSEAKQKLETVAKGASVKEVVDKKLIGGARVRIDERILDGSIKGKLNRLKTALEK